MGVKYLLMRNFECSVGKAVGVHLFQKFLFHKLRFSFPFIKVSVSPQKKLQAKPKPKNPTPQKTPNKQTTLEGNSVLHLASCKDLCWSCFLRFHQLKKQVEFFCVFPPNFLWETLLLRLVPFSFLWMWVHSSSSVFPSHLKPGDL